MKYAFWVFIMFASGMAVYANLSRLMPTNSHYEASWWKVGIAVLFCIMAALFAKEAADGN